MKKRVILSILFVLSLSLISMPAFAVSDSTLTLTPETVGSQYLCGGTSSVSCEGYQYLLVNIDSTSTRVYNDTITSNYTLTTDTSSVINSRLSASPLTTSYVVSLPSNLNSLYTSKPAWLSQGTVTLTLSESQGCPACPAPEPCPDPVEAPYFVQLVIDAFWKYHVAFAGGAVAILAIFLFYRIIKGRLR